MATDTWQQFKDVFEAVLALPPGERAAYLERTCTEPSVRAEVESLLVCYQGQQHHPDKKTILDHAKTTPDATTSGTVQGQRDPLIESLLDRYLITEKISQKGSIELYRAVRMDPSHLKPVVISVLKEGSTSIGREDARQRALLTGLQHPNIAQFLDLGVTNQGRRYWVREDVEGIPIEQYCDAHRLSTIASLKVFLSTCQGIQHAHERFLGHGRLSSDSIVVEHSGNPKIIDMGIAELLAQWGWTREEYPIGLEYISPARRDGSRVTAADDVFSLGVILYRLLTGYSPFPANHQGLTADPEIVKPSRVIRQKVDAEAGENPVAITPHSLRKSRNEKIRIICRQLRGDLDSIILKAIQKDAWKRYSSVEQFCGDIRLYLEGRPVRCRRNTLFYRAVKFLKRHQSAATFVGCCLALLTVFAINWAGGFFR